MNLSQLAILLVLYLCAVGAIAWLASRHRVRRSLGDFYLAGRSLSTPVLVLTLYATQYSGNSLLGYPGQAYRVGFGWILSAGFMTAVVLVYLTFALKLQRLAGAQGFVTPADWIDYRFRSRSLTVSANALMILALCNYLLAQLTAAGHLASGLSGGELPYAAAVLAFGVVVVAYETVGGMRAVAWTDVLQGLLLALGLLGLVVAALQRTGGLSALTNWLMVHRPELVAPPTAPALRGWASTVLLVGFGAAVYPQAVQRIYAARDAVSLRRSLAIMAFLPLLTIPVVVLVGLAGVREFSGEQRLSDLGADEVMPLLLARWSELGGAYFFLTALVVLGALAAIMSTADSVLLSLSSMLAKDVLARTLRPSGQEAEITRLGKLLSWLLMSALALVAISPRVSLWGLIELKIELLIQVAPLFVLGVPWAGLRARPALVGMLVGTFIALVPPLVGWSRPWQVHWGLIGAAVNVALGVCGSLTFRSSRT